MGYTPYFMQSLPAYHTELAQVTTAAKWVDFRTKWFDVSRWPQKTDVQVAQEASMRIGPFRLGGRLWGFTSSVYDITPDARYEYFKARLTVGMPLQFPQTTASAKIAENGWIQVCPYCEIFTDQIGPMDCPKCGRKLLFEQISS